FGNPSASDQQNKTGVWDSNYVGVYHLPNGASLSANDSTSNANNGSLQNSPTAIAGQIDGAMHVVQASTQYVNLGTPGSLNPSSITYEAWVNAASLPNAYNAVVSKVTSDYSAYAQLFVKSNGKLSCWDLANSSVNYDGTGSYTLSPGTWYHVA